MAANQVAPVGLVSHASDAINALSIASAGATDTDGARTLSLSPRAVAR